MHRELLRLDLVRRFAYFYIMDFPIEGHLPLLEANVLVILAQARNRTKPSSTVPFQRDKKFVGRQNIIADIEERHKQAAGRHHMRVALVGLAGVG
jgi:hypothetical protein